MSKVFVIDVARCSGCYNCQFACKDEHCGNEFLPYAASQPLTGQFWIKMKENVCGSKPKINIHYYPLLCNHCDRPICKEVCDAGAVYKRDDGLVIIDPTKCTGCKKCMEACPYDCIYFNEEKNIAQKCTGCAHLIDNGERKTPRCVDVCASDAFFYGEEEELKRQLKGAVVMKPETGLGPRVYYKNIPGKFIAGTVYDPVKKEVIRNAKCHLSCGPRVWDVYTDFFGDFWFKDLPESFLELRIEAKGYEPLNFKDIDTEKCVNLGDLPMQPLNEDK